MFELAKIPTYPNSHGISSWISLWWKELLGISHDFTMVWGRFWLRSLGDNGPMYAFYPNSGYSWLRGGKGQVLEGGVRTPRTEPPSLGCKNAPQQCE